MASLLNFLLLVASARSALAIQASLRTTRHQEPVAPVRQVLENDKDMMYVADFTVGGQPFKGILDTGSFDLVLFSQDCISCGIAASYIPAKSPTFHPGALYQQLAYGSGACATQEASDEVTFAGRITSENQSVWVATSCNMPLLMTASFQSIVGMGPPGCEKHQVEDQIAAAKKTHNLAMLPELEKLLEETLENVNYVPSQIHEKTFSTCLGRDAGSPGYWIWNDVTPDPRPGLVTAHVPGKNTWSVMVDKASFVDESGTATTVGCTEGCAALVDTGTTYIGVNTRFYNEVFNHINSMGKDCSDVSAFPEFTFKVGDEVLTLPPEAYIAEVLTSGLTSAQTWMHRDSPFKNPSRLHESGIGMVQCQLLLMDMGEERTDHGTLIILGMAIFREYYTTFDLGSGPDSRTIFFSPASSKCEPMSAGEVAMNGGRHHGYGFHNSTAPFQRPRVVDITRMRPPRPFHGNL